MKSNEFINEIKKGQKDSNGYTKCWPDKHAEGTKKSKVTGKPVRNCVSNESIDEAANAAQQAAIAVNMKKHHQKPKHMSEDDQIDGMAKGEIQAIIDNATHIQRALEQGINLDGWMYSYVTVCNDHMNSVAEQIGNPDIDEEIDTQINEKNPGLWANIHAKQNRIKHGSGEHMRKPGSKGAPSNSDFKSINAAAKKESIDEELNRQFDAVEAMVDHLAEQHGLDSDTIWDLFETVSDGELLSETAAWQKSSGKNKNGGLNQKGVNSYRREHPGSKLKTAVTTKPSKLKKGGKAANRRKSFCARMKGMKKANTSAKTARDPDSRINKSLRKWNC
jgi:hypothetical protein